MNKGGKETLKIRIISTCFVVLALTVFKPFGLDAWQWQAYFHLVMLGVIGILTCLLTDVILKYIVRKPRSYDEGVGYIIRRNLWFQCINTPLVALGICLYRHFVLSDRVEGNRLSVVNYLETLLIIAFCSFAIGLYWRFKFRSRYLAAELEETRLLNEQLQRLQQEANQSAQTAQTAVEASGGEADSQPPHPEPSLSVGVQSEPQAKKEKTVSERITLSGTTSETISLQINHLLYIEAVGNYVKVCHLCDGKVSTDMLRATSKQMEDDLKAYSMIVRCHRAFLVNLGQVEQIVSKSGSMQLVMKYSHDAIPVSRSNMAGVKEAINGI